MIKEFNQFVLESRFDNELYNSCYVSDIMRMKIIDNFFIQTSINPDYNIEYPDYNKLIDTWDGYDDMTYIQNNLKNNEFIFYEGWVNSCWKGLYLKKEYKELNKKDAIIKVITERFPIIGNEFQYHIKNFEYFKHRGLYIMKIIFYKK